MPVSEERLDLVSLNSQPQWAFDECNPIRLAGGHGQEIIRSLYISDKVGSL